MENAENSGKLNAALKNLNPSHEYILFCVYKDSFAEFNHVKKLFVDKGFDYNWIICSADEDIKLMKAQHVNVQ